MYLCIDKKCTGTTLKGTARRGMNYVPDSLTNPGKSFIMQDKTKRKHTAVICHFCKKEFQKYTSKVEKSKTCKHYCSRTCCGKSDAAERKQKPRVRREYTPFKFKGIGIFLRRSRIRIFSEETDLTAEYLFELWEKQCHNCAYTGIPLVIPDSKKGAKNKIYTASLDRIDPKRGYMQDNVHFVSTAINFMRNDMSHEDTLKLLQLIKNSPNSY